MALDAQARAALALHRFGLGPRSESIAAIASDPRGALLAELDKPTPIAGAGLLSSVEAIRQSAEWVAQRKMARFARVKKRASAGDDDADESAMHSVGDAAGRNKQAMRADQADAAAPHLLSDIFRGEVQARVDLAMSCDFGFVERLTWFWSNHFCIAVKRPVVRAGGGAFEREAIRPHVRGRFVDMLLAVESHPAMLSYLDNVRSIGPNSPHGIHGKRGLNENLAREILELHTLGVRTGYTQADVTNFAKVITGWRYVLPRASSEHGGEFEFAAELHEPGAQTVLGRRYPDTGVEQGRAVLKDLARHPATARHIATKLATHFVADMPPDSLVDRLADRFRETGGDLKVVAATLVRSDEAWDAPRAKMKRPGEWIIAAMRTAADGKADIDVVMRAHDMLGEPLWRPPSPKGYSDQSAEWIDGIAERLDIATNLARRVVPRREPSELVEQALGPLASTDTRTAVARAGDRTQALALLFMAPEFQLR
jgi:uncharacterized protein (DUF1800 family)